MSVHDVGVQLLGVVQHIGARCPRVGQSCRDARPHHGAERGAVEPTPADDRPQRNGQAGLGLPPVAQVRHQREPVGRVGEPRLMDDQAGVVSPVPYRRHDFFEGQDVDVADPMSQRPQPEQQVGGCAHPRYRDACARQVVPAAAGGEHERSAATSQGTAGGQQLVGVQQPRQCGVGDLHQIVEAGGGAGVQHIDVREGHRDPRCVRNEPVGQRVEGERVVRARRDRQRERGRHR